MAIGVGGFPGDGGGSTWGGVVGVGGRGLWWVAGQVYGGAMCGDVAIVVWAGNLVCKLECIGSLLGPLLLS